jgi:NAD(P)-dependent dehydrogenase (short-subunit alcohol dehydrogenase family)
MAPKSADASPLRGKIALITGATRGIGVAIARALKAQGCNLVIAGRNEARLQTLERDLSTDKTRVLARVCDVRNSTEVHEFFVAVKARFHRLDILINNAGVAHSNLRVADLPVESWQKVIETNLTGLFLVTRAALPLMKSGGAIVNNLSISAKRVFPGLSAYNASKHGALGFTNTLREELRERGIRVIALLPGATDTLIWNSFWPNVPRKKMMKPKTVAQAVTNALMLPENSTVEELVLMPTGGAL